MKELPVVCLRRPVYSPSYIGLTSFQEKSIYAKLPWVAEKEPLEFGTPVQIAPKRSEENHDIGELSSGMVDDASQFLLEMRSLADIARKFFS